LHALRNQEAGWIDSQVPKGKRRIRRRITIPRLLSGPALLRRRIQGGLPWFGCEGNLITLAGGLRGVAITADLGLKYDRRKA
jgi:hypothetical protein